jgi:hypothetical protein
VHRPQEDAAVSGIAPLTAADAFPRGADLDRYGVGELEVRELNAAIREGTC